ncbi:Pr6Pr family membrane protein [Herbaspirillum sp. LeCh32-8]|uniref:Pr6Pr family membrane protein n=1 Tax=Herbaspirillum sp. LeCh32-8 TaxID=2821356 RepID=UPI001AE6DBB4|nr:Pr6Pr family membrane protein [Herbaspirillum sp. LeCh32-8]MBP0600221.1 Pr6Pr family membrane protein [Herbaspirillum sp. LeCh32-8]
MSHEQIPSPQSLDSFGANIFPAQRGSSASRALAAVIAMISWFAFVAQTDITLNRLLARGGGILDGLDRLTMYLTNLTILMAALCFTSLALSLKTPVSRFFRQPSVISAVVAYLAFVGIAYNLLLRQLWAPSGFRSLVNESLHTVVPLLAIVYWIFFVPVFRHSVKKSLLWLVYPLGYLFITLWRGALSGFYPYPFIDVNRLGYPRVILNSSLLFVGFMVLMTLFVAINHSGKPAFLRR